jgi:hypothetical protein
MDRYHGHKFFVIKYGGYTTAISPLLSNMGEIYHGHKFFVIKYGGMSYRGRGGDYILGYKPGGSPTD